MAHEKYQSCIDSCLSCATECNHCAVACLQEDNVKKLARCIKLDLDCAAMNIQTAELLSRDSEFAKQMLSLCADINDACAAECEKHASMHDHCRKCAEACRKCADECRNMMSMAGSM